MCKLFFVLVRYHEKSFSRNNLFFSIYYDVIFQGENEIEVDASEEFLLYKTLLEKAFLNVFECMQIC